MQGQAKQDACTQCYENAHFNEAPFSFVFFNTIIINLTTVKTGPSIVNLQWLTHTTSDTYYGPLAFLQIKNVISLTYYLEITPTIKIARHLDKVVNWKLACIPIINFGNYDFGAPRSFHPP